MPRWERPVARLRGQAQRLASAGKFDEAVALYRQIVAARPDAPEHRNRLAELLARTERNAEAAAAWRETARMYEADGALPRAVTVWRKVAQQSPEDPDARVHLAVLLRRQGRYAQAMAADADAAMIWARCGEVEAAFQLMEPLVDWLLAGRDPGAAAERLEQILVHDRSHARALQKLAVAYRLMGRRSEG